MNEKLNNQNFAEEIREGILTKTSKYSFYKTSKFDFEKLIEAQDNI